MCWQKNFDALAAPPGGELPARHLPGERAACVPSGADSGLNVPLCEPGRNRGQRCDYGFERSRRCGCAMDTARIRVLLNREGWKVGKKLVYRLYKEEGLTLRHKPRRKRRAALHRRERFRPTTPNEVWSLDFVADQLADGRRFRALTIMDIFTRESLEAAKEWLGKR